MVTKVIIDRLCDEFDNERRHVEALLELLTSGAAPPFIARYRREATGCMSWSRIQDIERRFRFLDHMERRKQHFIDEAGKAGKELDPAVVEAIQATYDPARFEDLTRPFGKKGGRRKKRRDGQAESDPARLAPLLEKVKAGDLGGSSLMEAAAELVDAKAGHPDAAAVLDGAVRALAGEVAADLDVREKTREKLRQGVLHVRAGESRKKGAERYKDLGGLREPISRIPAAKLLAVLRGVREKHLNMEILIDQIPLGAHLEQTYFPGLAKAPADLKRFAQDAIRHALTNLVIPDCTGAIMEEVKDRRGREAVRPIQNQLRSLLMAPPFPGQTVLAVDPDPKKGHRLVVATPDGSFQDDALVKLGDEEKQAEARTKVKEIIEKYGVNFIAVAAARGQGREIKIFLRQVTAEMERTIPIETVNDAGARNWATSQAAAQELPDVPPATRAVLSLARRVLDPLSEYVKLDPALLVAGSQAMDIPPRMLRSALNDLIEECVAEVGPDINFTTLETLARVPGLDSKLARELDLKRGANRFKNLEQLREVESVGDKVFTNCAGFLRLHDSDNPLDLTQIHPERYALVARLAQQLETSVADLLGNREKLEALDLEPLVEEGTCLESLQDIRAELLARGVDPRGTFEILMPPEEVKSFEDLKVEMKLKGRITRVADFGIFVDVGVEPEGLVHESRIPKSGGGGTPLATFTVGQVVEVRVVHLDASGKRLALSMLPEGALAGGRGRRRGPSGDPEGEGERRPRRPRRPGGRDEGPGGGGDRRGERRGGPRRGGRDGYGDRWGSRTTERVFKAKPSPEREAPEKTEKGEFTDLSDLKSLLGGGKPKPAHKAKSASEGKPAPEAKPAPAAEPAPASEPAPAPAPDPAPAPEEPAATAPSPEPAATTTDTPAAPEATPPAEPPADETPGDKPKVGRPWNPGGAPPPADDPAE